MRFILAFWLFLFVAASTSRGVFAQDSAPAAEDATILQKQSLDAEIIQLEAIYRGQLTEYRSAERDFQIARDQYRQLQTLASINAVTESAKKVMRLRSQALLTYFELMRTHLIAADGIDVSLKEDVLAQITAHTQWLQTHQTTVAGTNDREALNVLADTFTEQNQAFVVTSQEASSVLALGKLQNVFDRLNAVQTDVTAQESTVSGTSQSRASRETSLALEEAKTQLSELWADLNRDRERGNVVNFYDSLVQNLDPLYANLNKIISFLQEMARSL